jgi:uncharacterized protein YbjT (DUF2867 family)
VNDPLRLALFGPTGGTGRNLIGQAVDADYEIQALTRSPEKLQPKTGVTAIRIFEARQII